jgi:hypothetical protein
MNPLLLCSSDMHLLTDCTDCISTACLPSQVASLLLRRPAWTVTLRPTGPVTPVQALSYPHRKSRCALGSRAVTRAV